MFTMRTSKPSKNNKFYITKSKGGYSSCIIGKPKDKECNVLSNCVGYACGRFNEIIGSMKYPSLNCNAENFIERAKSKGLKVSSTPVLGGIMVWQKGKTLSKNDGAGHVEVVEKIIDNNNVITSASSYGGSPFFNVKRNNNNGRWGLSLKYVFRGCIINPRVNNDSANNKYIKYKVIKGDTLSKIAKKYNTTWQKLYQLNKSTIGNNPNLIKIGQILKIKSP